MKSLKFFGMMVLPLAFVAMMASGAVAEDEWLAGEYYYEEMGPASLRMNSRARR